MSNLSGSYTNRKRLQLCSEALEKILTSSTTEKISIICSTDTDDDG